MCSASPKHLTPRPSGAAEWDPALPPNKKPAPSPQSCRPWALGTSAGGATWIVGIPQPPNQPAPRTKLTLHSLQLVLYTLQLLGQLIACRLAKAGCKCDTGGGHPHAVTHSPAPAQPFLWRSMVLRGARTQLALTRSAGTASPHPGVRPGANSLEKEDPTHIHVWSALPVKRAVATRNVIAIPGPSSTRPQSCSGPGAEPVQGSQRSSSPPQPNSCCWPGLYGCCWEEMLLYSPAPSSSGLLHGVCSHREGRQLP